MYSIQKIDDTTFSLFINESLYRDDFYEFFILTNSLPFAYINDDSLFFHAEKVCLLEDLLKSSSSSSSCKNYKLNQTQCLHMIKSLSYQIKYFEEKGIAFLGFDIKDIIVINVNNISDCKFFIMGTQFATRFHSSSSFMDLLVPYEKPYFSSPEIIDLTKLPSKVHHKCCYYSLGALTVFCLLNEYLLKGNEVLHMDKIKTILKPIYLSKMYWFLIRCFNENVEERVLLYI